MFHYHYPVSSVRSVGEFLFIPVGIGGRTESSQARNPVEMDHYARTGQARPQMSPQTPPQAQTSGNNSGPPGAGAPTFFVDPKKGEINELKQVRLSCPPIALNE